MTMKVFELAKELNVGAVDLVDRLRESGINVRNHMVTLSEDELQAARKIFNPAPSSKTVVKKVIKKKVAKETSEESALKEASPMTARVVTSKASPASSLQSQAALAQEVTDSESESLSSKKIVKRKTVKTSKELDLNNEEVEATKDFSHDVEEDLVTDKSFEVKSSDVNISSTEMMTPSHAPSAPVASEKEKQSLFMGDMPKGLSIISRPEKKPEKVDLIKKDDIASHKVKEKSLFKEKMHAFTPIFVPEQKAVTTLDELGQKKPIKDFDATKKNFVKVTTITEDVDLADDDSESPKSKKRFGDLAAMVSKKGVEKKDITQLRADEELKYIHEVVGHGVYTPPKKKKAWNGASKNTLITKVKDTKRVVYIHGACTISELAQKLSQTFESLANKALHINLLISPEDYVGVTLANEIAALYDYRVENKAFDEEKVLTKGKVAIKDDSLPSRSPIVTIMGHVDHGKTTLLDYIRKEKVAAGEAGGITQHIGAYTVPVGSSFITFLDTPGHAAFASMRQRGANLTDVVVLVVAADDGVMPQTIESIRFIQNAKVPLIVAINKIDKPDAKPDRIKQELMQYSITPEEWGGDTQFVEVSALKGLGIDKLLESINVQAEMMNLRETATGPAECIVVESKLETGRGPVCTVIVQKGKLSKGEIIVCGETSGRTRGLMDHTGKQIQEAGPSVPVQILGLESVPSPGDKLFVVESEKEAKKIVDNRINERKALELAEKKKLNLEDFFATSNNEEGGKKLLKLIVRSDVIGSFEAIKSSIESLGNDEVGLQVIGGGAGAITDNDVMMAHSSKGYIVGFNMRPVTSARRLAEDKGVDIKTYTIIYELIDDIRKALEGLLAPSRIERYIGRAQVKEVFNIPKIGHIAGSFVVDGKIEKGCNIRLLRDGKIIHDGKLSSLKRFKDDAKEVKNGLECGIALENFTDVKVNDIFEAYMMEEKKRTLEESHKVL